MYNNPSDRYVVLLRRGPAFGIEKWSAQTKGKALDLAIAFCWEDPDWVKVTNRKGKAIYGFRKIMAEYKRQCDDAGITEVAFGVSVNMKGGQFQTTVVPLNK